jgi:hypothetical protein
MAIERHYDTLTIVASQDLTGHMFKACDLAGGVAATTLLAKGVLRSKGLAGEHVTIAYKGQMKGISGAAIASGAQIGVTASGFFISVATSDYVGLALVAAGSGDIFGFVGDFNMGQVA